jgi:hypothetical protein
MYAQMMLKEHSATKEKNFLIKKNVDMLSSA